MASSWNHGHRAGLVSVGLYKLWLEVVGPDRKPDMPVVIVLPGIAGYRSEWAAVVRLLSPFVRVVTYDREGIGNSESSPLPPRYKYIVGDLNRLLALAGIGPPYLILASGYGGILAREFIRKRPNDHIAGLVLADTHSENTLRDLDPRPFFDYVRANGVDLDKILEGLLHHQMSPEESLQIKVDAFSGRNSIQTLAECEKSLQSYEEMAREMAGLKMPLLGSKPLSIVIGNSGIEMQALNYEVNKLPAVDQAERAHWNNWANRYAVVDHRLQSDAQRLSTDHIIYHAGYWSSHKIHLTEPALLAHITLKTMFASIAANYKNRFDRSVTGSASQSMINDTATPMQRDDQEIVEKDNLPQVYHRNVCTCILCLTR
ncbi:hypothetical protein VTL71DRAFT_12967 [Oculimacula yallundae]|uniref:AB hydrolase-1 domain-containing protein n=1 Tax=Oculimacula yallundae TaxID=86028 RepID=A0ABR4CQA0_9HELO